MAGKRETTALLVALGVLATRPAAGQDPRLARRLDSATLATVVTVIDSAQRQGLPAEPLVQRALEGAAKHAGGAQIVAAVDRLAGELATARSALGASSSPAELSAAAGALRAGVRATDLAELRRRRARPLTVALATLADLVASGVPPDSASAAVIAIAASARDEDLNDFRRAVERDIALGAPPGAAAAVRVDAALHQKTATPRRP